MRFLLFAIALVSPALAQDPYCAKYPETKFCTEKTSPKAIEDSAINDLDESIESEKSQDSLLVEEQEEYACRFNADTLLLWPLNDLEELGLFVQKNLGAAYEELARLESEELTSMQRNAIRVNVDNAIKEIVNSKKTFSLGRWMISDVEEFEKRELNAAGEKYKATLMKFISPLDLGAIFSANMQLGSCTECWKKAQKWYKVVLMRSNVRDSRLTILPSGAVLLAKFTVITKNRKTVEQLQRNTLYKVRGKISEMALGLESGYERNERPLFCPDIRYPGENRNKFGGQVAKLTRELSVTVEME